MNESTVLIKYYVSYIFWHIGCNGRGQRRRLQENNITTTTLNTDNTGQRPVHNTGLKYMGSVIKDKTEQVWELINGH